MKLPFMQRKKYDAIQNKNMKLMKDKEKLNDDLEVSNNECRKLAVDIIVLEKNIKSKEDQLKLASEYSDELLNKNCELNTKLIAATTKNEELEAKIKDLEFCLEEAKKENRKSLEIIKRTNIVKNLLINLTVLKDNQNRMLVEDSCILTREKVPANKVYEIVRLLG